MAKWTHKVTHKEAGWVVYLNHKEWQELSINSEECVDEGSWGEGQSSEEYLDMLKEHYDQVIVEKVRPIQLENK